MEGKVFLDKVLEATTKGFLLDCKGMVQGLLLCLARPICEKQEALLGQVGIARSRQRQGWLKAVARDADCMEFATREWIEKHVFTLPKLKKKTSESLAYPKDIRLKTNSTLEHRVENAATGDSCDQLLTEMESLLESLKEPALDYTEEEPMEVVEQLQEEPAAVENKENTSPTKGVKRTNTVEEDVSNKRSKDMARSKSGDREDPKRTNRSNQEVFERSIPTSGKKVAKSKSGGVTNPKKTGGSSKGAQKCPIPWCVKEFDYPKAHFFNFHCPTKLGMDAHGEESSRDRLKAIEDLASRCTGRADATGEDLLGFISDRQLAVKHENRKVGPWLRWVVNGISKVSKGRYPVPCVLDLNPMISPALIFHWAIMLEILSCLEPSSYNIFVRQFSDPAKSSELPQKLATTSDDVKKPISRKKSQHAAKSPERSIDLVICKSARPRGSRRIVTMKEGEGACSLEETLVPRKENRACSPVGTINPAFDSHFHMDRLRKKVKSSSWSLKDIEDRRTPGSVKPRVEVTGAVANFCDPDTYPTADVIRTMKSQGIEVTVGLHPKFAARASPSVMRRLKELVAMPEVVGIREIGLDQTVPSDEWPLQREVFAECLSMLEPRHVLVLHCRARCQDAKSDLFTSIFYHLWAVVPQEQAIHLHCFDGSASDVRRWSERFPNVYLGFTLRVEEGSFGDAEKKAVRRVQKDRLLLESDAPYFAPRGTRWSSPGCIGVTAKSVAKIRGEEYEEVLAQTLENGRRLYVQRRT